MYIYIYIPIKQNGARSREIVSSLSLSLSLHVKIWIALRRSNVSQRGKIRFSIASCNGRSRSRAFELTPFCHQTPPRASTRESLAERLDKRYLVSSVLRRSIPFLSDLINRRIDKKKKDRKKETPRTCVCRSVATSDYRPRSSSNRGRFYPYRVNAFVDRDVPFCSDLSPLPSPPVCSSSRSFPSTRGGVGREGRAIVINESPRARYRRILNRD